MFGSGKPAGLIGLLSRLVVRMPFTLYFDEIG